MTKTSLEPWNILNVICVMAMALLEIINFQLGNCYNQAAEIQQEYCQWETLDINCLENEIILFGNAVFAEGKKENCGNSNMDMPNNGHQTISVTDLLTSECSGKRSCEIRITDRRMLPLIHACGLACTLQVTYRCMEVATGIGQKCHNRHPFYLQLSEAKAISSSVADDTGCGYSESPWILQATPGQQISISMTDFGADNELTNGTTDVHNKVKRCIPYGYIVERATRMNKTICGGRKETDIVVLSNSHQVEIVISSKEKRNGKQFLLHYELRGCTDFEPKRNYVYQREDDTVTVVCKLTQQSWLLTCEDGSWIGVIGNCSLHDERPPQTLNSVFRLDETKNLIILLGLGGTILVLVVIALFGCIMLLRKRPSHYLTSQQIMHNKTLNEALYRRSLMANQATLINDHRMTRDNCIHIWESPLPEPLIPTTSVSRSETGNRSCMLADKPSLISLHDGNENTCNVVDHQSEPQYYILENTK